MRHSRAGCHALHIAGANHRTISHAIAMFERAGENVCDDLHIAV